MELREFGPDDTAAVQAAVAVGNAAIDVDHPWTHPRTPHSQAMAMRHGWDGEPSRWFLALADEQPVGLAAISTSDWDNLDLAWLHVVIHPEHRRRGWGATVLTALHDECRRLNRPLVGLDGWDGAPARGFAAAVGYDHKATSINRRQSLRDLGTDFMETAYAEAEPLAHDYELVRIAGRSPDELLEPLAVLTASINDAPLDDLEMEDEVYSAERVRGFEHAQTESGRRLYRVIARHRETGELAGHTVVTVEIEQPSQGEQEDTSVMASHRGHRLGLLLKADLGRWLLQVEPQLESLDTWNAESNDHMVGVNERLGYQVLGRQLEFQRRI